MELYQRIEHLIGKKLPVYETVEQEVMVLAERVAEAQRHARQEQKELDEKRRSGGKRKRGGEDEADDTEGALGVQSKIKKSMMMKGKGGGRSGGMPGRKNGPMGSKAAFGKGGNGRKKFRT